MSSISTSLKTITDFKSLQLDENDTRYAKYRQDVLESIKDVDPTTKLELLIDAISNPKAPRWDPQSALIDSEKLDRYRKLNLFSSASPVISDAQKLEWCEELITSLNSESEKYKYAKLFSKLVYEEDDITEESAEKASQPEMAEQRAQFESIVFSESNTDEKAIHEYLDTLFTSKKDLDGLRENVASFCNSFLPQVESTGKTITASEIEGTIRSLISSGLMDNDNTKVLREFLASSNIVSEITNVLNSKLASIGTWSWPKQGMEAAMRRQLNGKYRVYVHADLLDAIFTHYIGVAFGARFRDFFILYSNGPAWKKSVTQEHHDKNFSRFYYGGVLRRDAEGINDVRKEYQYDKYFLVQMPRSVFQSQGSYDGDDDDSDDGNNNKNTDKGSEVNVFKLKQGLLRFLVTEIELSKELGHSHTVIRSDYSWFGPSLSHTTILAVMKYIGVTEDWLAFFKTFLELPMRFSEDGPDAKMRKRSKGTPMSYSLSELFGETVLFMLDYAINRIDKGVFLYRAHDDFWLWHRDQQVCVAAWKEIQRFNKVMGLEINQEKTGSLTVNGKTCQDLPEGDIRWGFLVLNSEGKFVIDQANVDTHISEIKRQLAKPKAILTWISCYNSYVARFLPNNFAHPAPCFGYEHIDDIVRTLERVHQELFKEHKGSVTAFLSDWIEKRYGVTGLTTGWFYLPMVWGGLHLKAPTFSYILLQTSRALTEARQRRNNVAPVHPHFGNCPEHDRSTYDKAVADWKQGDYTPSKKDNPYGKFSNKPEDFPSFEKFTEERERSFEWWRRRYIYLLSTDSFKSTDLPKSEEVSLQFDKGGAGLPRRALEDLDTVYALYGEEMLHQWGGSRPIWDISLPLGMIEVWNKKKPVWAL